MDEVAFIVLSDRHRDEDGADRVHREPQSPSERGAAYLHGAN